MLRRCIEISREGAHLAIQHGQLVVLRPGQRKADAALGARFACEDLGVVITAHREITYTHTALASIAEAGAALVVCGADHLPVGLLLPVSGHSEVAARLRDQIAAGPVLLKRLWKRLVVAKIRGQAANLAHDPRARAELLAVARDVRSGDPDNREAHAARVYWPALFQGATPSPFRRRGGEPDAPPPNNLLDYGYGVMRAAVARALIGAGLLPALGIGHSNRSNAFALADDLLEPLRPSVDRAVLSLTGSDRLFLDQPTKAALISLLYAPAIDRAGRGPLNAILPRYAASLADAFRSGDAQRLDIPSPDTQEGETGVGPLADAERPRRDDAGGPDASPEEPEDD